MFVGLKQEGITQYGQVWTDKIIEKYLSNRARKVTEAIQLLVPGYVPELSYEKIIEQFNDLLKSVQNDDDVWWKDYEKFSSEAIEVKNEKDASEKAAEEAKKAAAAERKAMEDAKRAYDESPEGKDAIRQKNQAGFDKTQKHFAEHPFTFSGETLRDYGKGNLQ